MKKLDKLVISSFIGPFILTFFVTVFILLLVFMLKYFDDLVGKGIGFFTILELIFYFSINTVPNALPLAVLLSSLMTFGRLGEHFELIAIKSAGISLLRILRPIFFMVLIITGLSFINNNYIVPKANIKAYSLLYDIKRKKPSMDLQEGQFYNGLPGFSIKVSKKLPDGETLKEIIIYQHTNKDQSGNNSVIMADSSRMYTMLDDRYLVLDLYNGSYYEEWPAERRSRQKRSFINQFYRNEFASMKIVFNLASFNLGRTNEELFAGNRIMKNVKRLKNDADSMRVETDFYSYNAFYNYNKNSKYYKYTYDRLPERVVQSREKKKTIVKPPDVVERDTVDKIYVPKLYYISEDTSFLLAEVDYGIDSLLVDTTLCDSMGMIASVNPYVALTKRMDSTFNDKDNLKRAYNQSLTQIRRLNNSVAAINTNRKGLMSEVRRHDFQRYRKYAESFSCIIMFLIGAPLGAIIKRGGLGLPVLISIIFFVIFYVFTMMGDKWSKTGIVEGMYAAWMANTLLTPIGFFFLRQARIDARLFDFDIYVILIDRFKTYIKKRKEERQRRRLNQ